MFRTCLTVFDASETATRAQDTAIDLRLIFGVKFCCVCARLSVRPVQGPERIATDPVIVGRRGMGKIRQMLPGGVTTQLMQRACAAVLFVHESVFGGYVTPR